MGKSHYNDDDGHIAALRTLTALHANSDTFTIYTKPEMQHAHSRMARNSLSAEFAASIV